MFNKLDMNFDLLLDQSELSAIYLDKYELCMKPLFNSCDSFKDGKLSNNEWCYCFQRPEGEDRERAELLRNCLKNKGQGREELKGLSSRLGVFSCFVILEKLTWFDHVSVFRDS